MRKFSFIAMLGLCLLLLAQCTIQKRVYRKGWYVSFKKEWRNPGNEQSQEFTSGDQQKEDADLAAVSDFPPAENTPAETGFYDSSPQNISMVDETETPVRNTLPAIESEDTIPQITSDSGQLSAKPSKISTRSPWTKWVVIFLFCAALILILALLITTSPLDLATSVTFSAVMLGFVILGFLIGFAAHNNKSKRTKNQPAAETKKRLMTPDEQAQKKKDRKRGAIILTVFLGVIFLLLVALAFSIGSFVFLAPFGVVFAFSILVGWVEFARPRPMEMIEEEVIAPVKVKQYRQKTEDEKQAELQKHKRKLVVSAIFWTVIMVLLIVTAVSLQSLLFLLVGIAVCLLLIMIACLEYFRWKPKDIIEVEPVPEEESVNDAPVNDKRDKTSEEQRRTNRNRNIVLGVFFAFIAAFFIIGANN